MHASENAVLAKVRAMYAHRLTAADYQNMLSCRTPAEVAAYLKEKTAYGAHMHTVLPTEVHREWLENRLREAQHSQFEALSYYAYAINAQFYFYFILERETERLSHSLALVADRSNSELPAHSPFFDKHTTVDWKKIETATDLSQWLEGLKGSPYRKICQPFIDTEKNTVDMIALDHALDNYTMQRLLRLADAAYDHAEEKALTEHLKMYIDLHNIVGIYRCRRWRREPGFARSAVITEGGTLTDTQLEKLMQAEDDTAFFGLLSRTRYRELNIGAEGYIELSAEQYRYRHCRHDLRFTTFPSVALLCYVTLQKTELNNIIHIIEGVRYEQPETARQMLIGDDLG